MYKKLEKLTLLLILFAVGITLWCLVLKLYKDKNLAEVCTYEVEATIDLVEHEKSTDVYGHEYHKYIGRMIYSYNEKDYRTSIMDDNLEGKKYGDKVVILINPEKPEEAILK